MKGKGAEGDLIQGDRLRGELAQKHGMTLKGQCGMSLGAEVVAPQRFSTSKSLTTQTEPQTQRPPPTPSASVPLGLRS